MAYKRRKVKSTFVEDSASARETLLVHRFEVTNVTDTEVPLSIVKSGRDVMVRLGPNKSIEVEVLTNSVMNLVRKKIVKIK